MPPRWPTAPTRRDDTFRKQDDRYTLGAHLMVFSFAMTGVLFVQGLYRAEWVWLTPFALTWLAIALLHITWVLAIARYPSADDNPSVRPK